MHVAIAIHHPKPEHVQDFLAFMATVEAVLQGSPGLLSVESWRELGGGRLVGMSRWESQEDFTAALPRILAIGGRDPAWSAQPDEMLSLTRP